MTDLSKCCNSMVKVAHGCDSDSGHGGKECNCTDGTQWYECMKCGKPCEIKPEKKKAPIIVSKPIFTINAFGYSLAMGKIIKIFEDGEDFYLTKL